MVFAFRMKAFVSASIWSVGRVIAMLIWDRGQLLQSMQLPILSTSECQNGICRSESLLSESSGAEIVACSAHEEIDGFGTGLRTSTSMVRANPESIGIEILVQTDEFAVTNPAFSYAASILHL